MRQKATPVAAMSASSTRIYEGDADQVIAPAVTGSLGILRGHALMALPGTDTLRGRRDYRYTACGDTRLQFGARRRRRRTHDLTVEGRTMAKTTALDAEEHATTAAVGEEGPFTYPIAEEAPTTVPVGEEVVTTQAEGEEGPTTLPPGEEVGTAQSTSTAGNPFGAF